MQTKTKKLDRRVQYSRMVLRQSLLELLKRQPISKISVTDICALANVNRGTFYSHYSDQYDLLNQIQQELYDEIRSAIERTLEMKSTLDLLYEIFHTIEKNGDLCKVLFSDHGDKEFLWKVLTVAHDKTIAQWKASIAPMAINPVHLEWLYTFIVNGSIGIIQAWVLGGFKEDSSEIVQFIFKVSRLGLQQIL